MDVRPHLKKIHPSVRATPNATMKILLPSPKCLDMAQPRRMGMRNERAQLPNAPRFSPYRSFQAQINNLTGVGLYALQGLLSCGQFEIRQITSISALIST